MRKGAQPSGEHRFLCLCALDNTTQTKPKQNLETNAAEIDKPPIIARVFNMLSPYLTVSVDQRSVLVNSGQQSSHSVSAEHSNRKQ